MSKEPTSILNKALELAKPVVESGCALLSSLLGEPFKIAGGLLSDQLYMWQWRNRIRIAHQARQILEKDNIAPKVLPPGFLLPLLSDAGNVEDVELQQLWAQLLASAVKDPVHRHPAFVRILSQLAPEEGTLLSLIARQRFRLEKTWDYDAHSKSDSERPMDGKRFPFNHMSCDEETLWFYISHLSILGLIVPCAEEETLWDRTGRDRKKVGKRVYTFANVTALGRQFLSACLAQQDVRRVPVVETWLLVHQATKKAAEALESAEGAAQSAEEAIDAAEEAKDTAEEVRDSLTK